jgi:hypothetical protein
MALVYASRLLKRPFADLKSSLAKVALVCASSATVSIVIVSGLGGIWGFLLAGFMGVGTAVILLWVFERRYSPGLLGGLTQFLPESMPFLEARVSRIV